MLRLFHAIILFLFGLAVLFVSVYLFTVEFGWFVCYCFYAFDYVCLVVCLGLDFY